MDGSSLRLVQIVFRHGDKGKEIENLKNAGDSPLMELKTGKRKLRLLGKYIKERYNGFLTHDVHELSAKSSQVSRCVDSMVELLKGAYETYNELEESEIRGTISSKPILSDMMLFPLGLCPEADEEVKSAAKNLKPFLTKHGQVFALLKKNHGINNIQDFGFFRSKLEASGSNLPNGVTDEFATAIKEISNEMLALLFGSKKYKLLRGSEFFKTIVHNMDECIQQRSTKKLHLFCTHEHSLALFEMILDAYNGFPSFGQSLIFELHEISSEYFVVVYRLAVIDEQRIEKPVQIYPKGSANYQNLNDFMQDLKDYLQFKLPPVDVTQARAIMQDFSLSMKPYLSTNI